MTCEEAKILIGGAPNETSTELLEHLRTCTQCQALRQQTLALDEKLRRALELDFQALQTATALTNDAATRSLAGAARPLAPGDTPTPDPAEPSNVVVLPRRRSGPVTVPKQKRPRLMAVAASLVTASVVALTLWLTRPPPTLAAEIVKHVEGEPNSWSKTQPVANDHWKAVLRKSGVRLGPGVQSVVYASSCWFRGHFVPHFVLTTQDGPVTVMILLNEKVNAPEQFHEEGYSGLLVPASTGSVAVLSRTPMPLEQPADTVIKALQAAN
jgi:hypothetical protein